MTDYMKGWGIGVLPDHECCVDCVKHPDLARGFADGRAAREDAELTEQNRGRTCLLLIWSDREHIVFADDPEEIAQTILYCALDHFYSRTDDGVPHGLPDAWYDVLRPIVARHMAAKRPDWLDHTIDLTIEEEERFRDELRATVTALLAPRDPEVSVPSMQVPATFPAEDEDEDAARSSRRA